MKKMIKSLKLFLLKNKDKSWFRVGRTFALGIFILNILALWCSFRLKGFDAVYCVLLSIPSMSVTIYIYETWFKFIGFEGTINFSNTFWIINFIVGSLFWFLVGAFMGFIMEKTKKKH